MRTLQEKYNGLLEGTFNKNQFLRDARLELPNLITQFNGYDDAVQILKNRGMIQEANLGHNEISSIHQEGGSWIVTYKKDGTKEKVFKTEKEARDFEKTLSEAGGHASINNLSKFHGITGDKLPEDKEGLEKALKAAEEGGNKRTAQIIRIALKKLNEARLTKNNLTDYRYKPTNEMDKYPYEQILRGLRVELEVMEVQGTPSAEEYAKALSKVSKNLAKDSIFYTNTLAGNNKKVDLHDKMVDATAKNTVDTFNGMKKIKDLKEDHSKNPNDKYVVRPCKNKKEPWAVWEGEKRVKGFATKEEAKEYADKQNKKQGLTESVLKEGIKNLIKKVLSEGEDIYEMQGPKSDDEYKSELADYLDDNQIYGYTNRIHDIMTGPDEDKASEELSKYLDDNQIYGYNRAIESIYADYPYDQHWMNQPDEVEIEGINEESDEDKLARYKNYTYMLDGEVVSPEIGWFDNYIGAELDGKLLKVGIPSEDGVVQLRSPQGKTGMYTENIFESKSLKDLLN